MGKKIGGDYVEEAYDAIRDSDGNLVIVGISNTGIEDLMWISYDFYIVKLNPEGEIIWEKKYGGTGMDVAYSIVEAADGGYLVAGISDSNDNDFMENYGVGDGRIIKLDTNGNLEWSKNYGGTGQDEIKSILSNGDGTFTLAGSTGSSDYDLTENQGGWDFWVFKIDSSGGVIWSQSFGGSQYDFGQDVISTQEGGLLVGGYTDSNDFDVLGNFGQTDYWVLKLDALGNLEWSKTYGGSHIDQLYGLTQTDSGDFGLVGHTDSSDFLVSNNYGEVDVWLLKIDAAGNILWARNYGSSSSEEAYAISSHNNQFFITGMSGDIIDHDLTEVFGLVDLWMFKVDSSGELIWQKSMGYHWADYGKSIQMDTNGNWVVAGHFEYDNLTNQFEDINMDFWIINFADAELSTIDQTKSLVSIYPNPTQNLLFFSEELNQIEIYNPLGQKVKTSQKGTHINLSKFPKGTYFLKAKTINGTSVEKKFLKN